MNWKSWIILLTLLALPVVLVQSDLHQVQYRAEFDEGVYLHYAQRVATEGIGVFPQLFEEYLRDSKTSQYFPSPVRLTSTLLGACAVRIWGPNFEALQRISLLSFLALLILVFIHLNRTAGGWTAVGVTLLLSASPLHLAMAQRALTDSLSATLMLISLWFFIETLLGEETGSRERWWGVALLYLVTLLAKEAFVVLTPISLALMGWQRICYQKKIPLFAFFAVSFVPLVGFFGLVSLAAGGFPVAWKTLWIAMNSVSTNEYAKLFGAGPWFRYIIDGMLLSPWTVLLFLFWLGVLLGRQERNPHLLAWALVPVLFLICSSLATKNIRYALLLETPVRLGAVFFLYGWVKRGVGARWVLVSMGVLIISLVYLDMINFHHLFVNGKIYDPMSYELLNLRGLLPK